MKKQLLTLLAMTLSSYCLLAQPFENEDGHPTFVHLITGMSSYSGDLKLEKYSFNQSKPLVGLGIQQYISNHVSLRAEAIYTSIGADDKLSGEKYRLKRNLNFTSTILDGSLLVQYDLFGMNDARAITPYIFVGGGYYHYSPYTKDANGNKISMVAQNAEGTTFQLSQFNIATGFGLLWKMSDNFEFGAEFNSKILFTDYLDGVSKRGNPNNKDNYYYTAAHFVINLAAFRSNSISYFRH